MPREKPDFQENLRLIQERLGRDQLLPLKKVAEYCGRDYRTLQKTSDFPLKKIAGRYFVPAVGLARWLS